MPDVMHDFFIELQQCSWINILILSNGFSQDDSLLRFTGNLCAVAAS
jgi:hypothetical protein